MSGPEIVCPVISAWIFGLQSRYMRMAASAAAPNPQAVMSPPSATMSQPARNRGPPAVHRLHQLGARSRPFRDADLPDGGDRARGDLRQELCRADRARHRLVRRLRRVLAAGRLARRPLEPAQHDGAVLRRLRGLADRGRARRKSHPAGARAHGARHVRRDLSPGRHRHADRAGDHARALDGVQRRVRQSRRRVRGRASRRCWRPGSGGARPSWCRA